MSRIILSTYSDGHERLVVGWDHPCGGCFWQEFNQEPGPCGGCNGTGFKVEGERCPLCAGAGKDYEGWVEILRHGGMAPGIPLDRFRDSIPGDLRPLITDDVMRLLLEHAEDPDSGLKRPIRVPLP